MGQFAYRAKNSKGKIETGKVMASSKNEAMAKVRAKKLRPVSVRAHKDTFFSNLLVTDSSGKTQINLSAKVNTKELAVFAKQFSIMLERGIPILQALDLLAKQQPKIFFRNIIENIKEKVENGTNLSDALAEYPKIFDDLFVSMIRAGEISGGMDKTLLEIVAYLERSAKLKSQVKSAMMYPIMIVVVAVSVVGLLLYFVIPTFAKQYSESGQELPVLTQVVIAMSEWSINNIGLIVVVFGASIFGSLAYSKTSGGKRFFDNLFMKIPITGDVVRKIAVGRFSSTMATMLMSGVAILDALTICASAAGNVVIESFINQVKDKVTKGMNLSVPMAEGDIFPPMVVSMVAIGEQTGALDESLKKVSMIYEEEVEIAVRNLTGMIQPIMIVGIGAVVGTVVIALYLPIFDMASTVGV